MIAVRKSDAAAAESRRKARRQAQKDGYRLSQATLAAADWFILVTSLAAAEFSTDDVLALYRLRWRVETQLQAAEERDRAAWPTRH